MRAARARPGRGARASAPPPARPGRGRGGQGVPRAGSTAHNFTFLGYREYELSDEDGELTPAPRSPAPASASCARAASERSRGFDELPPARARAGARALPAQPHQGQLARDGAPARLPRLRRRQALRRGRQRDRRAALPRPLHAQRPTTPARREIPILRRKVEAVLDARGLPARQPQREGADRDPRDLPARRAVPDRRSTSCSRSRWASSHLGERQRVRLFVRRDPFGRFVSCLVFVPRDRFNTREPAPHRARSCATRSAPQRSTTRRACPSRCSCACTTWSTREPGAVPRLRRRARSRRCSWPPRARGPTTSRRRWSRSTARSAATRCFRRYGDAFPAGYRADWVARSARRRHRADRGAGGARRGSRISLYRPLEAPHGVAARQALPRAAAPLALSDVLPAVREHGRARSPTSGPTRSRRATAAPTWIYDFGLTYAGDGELDADEHARALPGRVRRASGAATSRTTATTALVLRAGLDLARGRRCCARSRATCARPGTTFSDRYMERALRRASRRSRALLVRAVPGALRSRGTPTPSDADAVARRASRRRSTPSTSLDEDRILRSFLAVVAGDAAHELLPARRRRRPKPYLSFKLDPSQRPAAAAAAPALRDLRLLAARRGRAPARRRGRPRRPALVGPARGLPHRGPRPDEGADGEERA